MLDTQRQGDLLLYVRLKILKSYLLSKKLATTELTYDQLYDDISREMRK